MSFTLVAFQESQDTVGVLVPVASLTDQHITQDGDDIYVPAWAPNVMAVFALGATATDAKLTAPSMREGSELQINPINVGAEPISNPRMVDMFDNPRPLNPSEGMRAYIAAGSGTTEYDTILVWLGDTITPIPAGDIETIRFTATTTLVAQTWTACDLTPDQQLRAGRYAVVGMKAISAGAVSARLIIPGSAYRPGVIAFDAVADCGEAKFRRGAVGVFGEFDHRFIPKAEFNSVSADTAETVWLDLIYLG